MDFETAKIFLYLANSIAAVGCAVYGYIYALKREWSKGAYFTALALWLGQHG